MSEKYFYAGIKEARRGHSKVYHVSDAPVPDYKMVFGGNTCEYIGDEFPHIPYYDEELRGIRVLSLEEQVDKGIIILPENHIVVDGEIKKYDPRFYRVVDGKLIEIPGAKEKYETEQLNQWKRDSLNQLKIDLELEIITQDAYNESLEEIKKTEKIPGNY